jgi:hypothetical protein
MYCNLRLQRLHCLPVQNTFAAFCAQIVTGMAQEGTKMPRTVNFFLPPNCYRPIDVKKLDGQRKGQGFKLKIDLAVLTIIL